MSKMAFAPSASVKKSSGVLNRNIKFKVEKEEEDTTRLNHHFSMRLFEKRDSCNV